MKRLWFSIFFLTGLGLVLCFTRLEAKSASSLPETVVIDPGHGGRDTGTVGLSGLKEKDLCLSLAKQLAEALEKQLGLRVILTRNGDHSLGQFDRSAVANHQQADLFLSLHFNADFSDRQRGMEIYILDRPQDKNKVKKPKPSPEANLWDEAQLNNLEQSHRLAQSIYRQAVGNSYIKNVSIYASPMLVLKGVTMPAVLIELAYLSQYQEEKDLLTKAYKQALTEIISKGILNYKKQSADNARDNKNEP